MSTLVPRVSSSSLSSIKVAAQTATNDVWEDFFALLLSPNTKRTYASALNDFFVKLTGTSSSPQQLKELLSLSQFEAIGVVLKYQGLLIDLGLAPSTINTRLSALKSLTNHARKLGQCSYSLEDIKLLHVENYRDTSGVSVDDYRSILQEPDRSTVEGKRNYAILRLLWDNAIRRGELASTNVEDFRDGKLWILRKGQRQKQPIDLAARTAAAVREWLETREEQATDPIFIALDNRSYGKRLSGRSVARVVDWTSTDAGVDKRMSPHRVRHSSITAALDATNGDVRTVQQLSGHADLNVIRLYDDNRKGLQKKVSNLLSDLV
jgi:integrase/recombinase XerC